MASELGKKILSGLGWSGLSLITRESMRIIIFIILARLLSPKEFGLLGMVTVLTYFANIFVDMGFGAAIIQRNNIKENHLNAVFWANLIIGIALTIIFIIISSFIASFYKAPILKNITIVLGINFIFMSLFVVQNAILRKNLQFKEIAIIENIGIFISGIIAISLALLKMGIWSLVAQAIVPTAVIAFLMWYVSPWRPSYSFKWKALKELFSYSFNLLGFSVIDYFTRNSDSFLIGKFVGASELGLYSRAQGLMILPLRQSSSIFTRVMFPIFSIIKDDPEKVKIIYLRLVKGITLIIFPLMIGLLVVADNFVIAVFGKKWVGLIPLVKLFAIAGLWQSINITLEWLYTSQGRTDFLFRWGIISALVRLFAFIIGLRWGYIGVAWSYVITTCIVLWYPSWIIPGRLINLSFKELIKSVSSPLLCALSMGIIVWYISAFLPLNWSIWFSLIIKVSFGILIYIIILQIFQLQSYREIKYILSKQIKTRLRISYK